jgi:hypothetical protein
MDRASGERVAAFGRGCALESLRAACFRKRSEAGRRRQRVEATRLKALWDGVAAENVVSMPERRAR